MGMLVDDMLQRMPALEFMERLALVTIDANPEAHEKSAQTPEEILALFPPSD